MKAPGSLTPGTYQPHVRNLRAAQAINRGQHMCLWKAGASSKPLVGIAYKWSRSLIHLQLCSDAATVILDAPANAGDFRRCLDPFRDCRGDCPISRRVEPGEFTHVRMLAQPGSAGALVGFPWALPQEAAGGSMKRRKKYRLKCSDRVCNSVVAYICFHTVGCDTWQARCRRLRVHDE